MGTVFSKVVSGEISTDIVYQDDTVTAFRDANPIAPVHILIIPNQEIPTMDDVTSKDEPLLGHMLVIAKEIARGQGIAERGYRLIMNCRADAGQQVNHLHIHLLGGRELGPLLADLS